MDASITFIGKIHSVQKRIEDCPLQESENAPEAVIEIFPEYHEGVQDIVPGSQLLLFTWLHLANRKILSCKPRNNADASLTGVFSTRSPDRPNPIGMHSVKVISLPGKGLIKVSALEVLDQTPLIDIKPVLNKQLR